MVKLNSRKFFHFLIDISNQIIYSINERKRHSLPFTLKGAPLSFKGISKSCPFFAGPPGGKESPTNYAEGR